MPKIQKPKSAHTPTPWAVDQVGPEGTIMRGEINGHGRPEWRTVARFKGPQEVADANAAFAVRAVNAHDELLAAAKEVIAALDSVRWGAGETFRMTADLSDALRSAIAKAEAI